MVTLTAIVDPIAGAFCPDGMATGRIVVTVPFNPVPRLHRYSGNPAEPIRDATAQEVAAYDAAQVDAQAARELDDTKALKAAVICALWGRLGRQPNAGEIAAERTRFINVYKAL